MKKLILGVTVAASIASPLAVAATASAAPLPNKATGTVTWDYDHGQVTGQCTFNASFKTGGSLDYQNSNSQWLHGDVAPGSYQKIDDHTAVFAGEITSGSDDYTVNHPGTDYFSAKVVDFSTSGRNGDTIAVLANKDGNGNELYGNTDTTVDYPMTAETAGIVTAGNLTVF